MGDPGVSIAPTSRWLPATVSCPVRQVILPLDPSGIKAADQERIVRKLAAERLGTVSVL